jgi:predicted kinase
LLTLHINPDHFLQTAAGRVTTPERNAEAWRQCFAAFDAALQSSELSTRVYLLIGPQGSGKSTWARRTSIEEPLSVFFDAILVKRSERSPILAKTRERGVPAIAVWFRTPLAVCLARNSARPPDEIAAEQGIRNVYAAVEPPSHAEGFAEIVEVGRPGD